MTDKKKTQDPDNPFQDIFGSNEDETPESRTSSEPSMDWKADELKKYAADGGIDLGSAKTKQEILSEIESAAAGTETDETAASKDPEAAKEPAPAVPTSKETSPDSVEAEADTTEKPGDNDRKPGSKKNLDHTKLPVTIIQGGLQGSITLQNGRPVLKVSPRPWIGEEPLVLAEGQLDDLIDLLDQIRKESR